ncbi:MAG: hypothetical protein K6D02_01920 [Lachnospiraceae bacterium]|nr:hypothetical protein [Lachnospiraceae bacterium]
MNTRVKTSLQVLMLNDLLRKDIISEGIYDKAKEEILSKSEPDFSVAFFSIYTIDMEEKAV